MPDVCASDISCMMLGYIGNEQGPPHFDPHRNQSTYKLGYEVMLQKEVDKQWIEDEVKVLVE